MSRVTHWRIIMLTYAGIGARKTPDSVLECMSTIAQQLASKGAVLRSGGAAGADLMFEGAAKAVKGKTEIFDVSAGFEPADEAYEIARILHPAWGRCKEPARKLHARNAHILLGEKLDSPVDLVICWTPEGKVVGGTGQALRHAIVMNVPILNLAAPTDADRDFYRRLIKG